MTFEARRWWVVVTMVAVVAAMSLSAAAQQGSQGLQAQFERARLLEENSKTLNEAIALYKQVAAQAGSNRALAAQALVRMAECHLKLGDAEAQRIYERVMRDFSDQKEEAALARARLGGRDAFARSQRERLISLDPRVVFPGTVSADGRLVSYSVRATGDVVVRNLSTGVDRVLSKATPTERGGYSVMSRDGKQVAYGWQARAGRSGGIYIASTQGTGAPEVRRLLAINGDGDGLLPLDWSPDGRWLVVARPGGRAVAQGGSGPEIALVSAQDGALRVLKSLEWGRFPRNIFFSPDSRYVAYSQDVRGTRGQTRVVVMAIDGAPRENVVVDHPSENHIMGWSPDGASLVVASDRNGSSALWIVPVRDGQSHGTPTRVEANLGPDPVSLGVTASGALHAWKFTSNLYLHVAPIDLTSGKLLSDPASSVRAFVGGGGKPTWSADGRQLAYYSCTGSCNRTGVIKVRTIDTEHVRELPFRLTYLQAQTDLVWSPDGRTLTVNATDLNGRSGLHRIDAQNGETQPSGGTAFVAFQGTNVTTDGTKVYAPAGGSLLERDIASGNERVLFKERAPGNALVAHSSPDRRYTAFVETATTKASTLFVMPYGGGEPRELFRATGFDRFGRHGMAWTPDARSILMIAGNEQSRELWLVPVSDGPPRKLEIDVDNWLAGNFTGGFTLRPNGREVAFVAGEVKEEIWALENFLPPTPAAARR